MKKILVLLLAIATLTVGFAVVTAIAILAQPGADCVEVPATGFVQTGEAPVILAVVIDGDGSREPGLLPSLTFTQAVSLANKVIRVRYVGRGEYRLCENTATAR